MEPTGEYLFRFKVTPFSVIRAVFRATLTHRKQYTVDFLSKCTAVWISGLALFAGCAGGRQAPVSESGMEYARWFDLDGDRVLVTSPYDGHTDTLYIDHPMDRIVCMSTSYIGFLQALGCDSVAVGVSGVDFVGNPYVRSHAREVGYDAALDYEAILGLQPDLLMTYAVSSAEPPCFAKLRDLGIPVAVIHEHLESHPLARAEYIKLFGALTGCRGRADSLFASIRDRYEALTVPEGPRKKVLLNIPYADEWYIPGGENYMSRLIEDAGGRVLGAVPGAVQSSVIHVEKAYALAREADVWLNPGWCTTLGQLRSVHPLFADFPVLRKSVWNNNRSLSPGGGNIFWETGPVSPDRVLDDLVRIFQGEEDADGTMNYFQKLSE